MRLSPSEVQAELAVGREAYRRGDVGLAIQKADFVLRSNPDCVQAHFAKGMMAIGLNRFDEAMRSFTQVLGYDPANSEALSWAAITSLNLGQAPQAETLAKRLVKVQPNNDRAHFVLTNSLCVQGRLNEALTAIGRALALKPEEPDYVVGKAQILGRLHWDSQAIEWYRRAIGMRPSPELAMELAESLVQESQVAEALDVIERFQRDFPPGVRTDVLLGQAYTEAQQFERAKPFWISAAKETFDGGALALAQANSEIFAGRLAVAEELLRGALDLSPSTGQLYLPLTNIRKITSEDLPLIESMERLLAEGNPAAQDLNYALGKSYQDLGDYRKAMGYFDEANRLAYLNSGVSRKFDREQWRAYTDFLIGFFTKERLTTLTAQGIHTQVPLFIVGMIRSGTTLAEQILSSHSKVRAGGEKTFWADHRDEVVDRTAQRFNEAAAHRLGMDYLATLSAVRGSAAYVSEKNPSNVMLTAALYCIYPKAKFLHMKRNPVDNLLSIWTTPLQTGLPFVNDRENLVAAYRDYLRLARHLQETIPDENVKSFAYEDVTSNPEATIRAMLGFLELEPEPDCFAPESNPRTVRTPSFYQVRQPINTDSQARWKRYEPWLGPFGEFL